MSTATLNSPPVIGSRRAQPSRLLIVLAFFAIYVVWGTTYLAIRFAVETIPPLVTAGIRHTIAGLILLAIARSRGFRPRREHWIAGSALDRKSTRLNSSHTVISYAVFCLKKK